MKCFSVHEGIVAPLDRTNVDTDTILPKQFLKMMTKEGYGQYLFYYWKYLDGEEENPEFILNQENYRKASVLLTRDNFGSGSSREHAVWSISDFGFRVIISTSFAEIFYSNCFKNGILPIVLTEEEVNELFTRETNHDIYHLKIDLLNQKVMDHKGFESFFEIDPFQKEMLLNGWDEINMSLQDEDAIKNFEAKHQVYFRLNVTSDIENK